MRDETTTLKGRVYRRLLGETVGPGAQKFLRDLSLVTGSFAIAKVISGVVNIVAARLLGPHEYGAVNVLVSAGATIAPFMLLGLQYSVVKYGGDLETRPRVFGSALAVSAAACLLVCLFALVFRGKLSDLFHIDPRMLFFSLAYAATTAGYLMMSGMQQALGQFTSRGLNEIGFSVIVAVVFSAGFALLGRSYDTMAWAYIAGFGGVAFSWLAQARRYVKFDGFSKSMFGPMAQYGLYNFGASVGVVMLVNVQGLIVSAAFSARETGIYAAHYTGTIGVAGYIAYAVTTVLFPKASSTPDRRRLWDLAVKGWVRAAALVVVGFVALELLVLTLMGRFQYGLNPRLIFLFAICGTLMLVQSSLSQIVLAEGVKGSRLGLYMTLGCGALNLIACLVLVPKLGVEGVTLAFILSYSAMIAWLWKAKDSYVSVAK